VNTHLPGKVTAEATNPDIVWVAGTLYFPRATVTAGTVGPSYVHTRGRARPTTSTFKLLHLASSLAPADTRRRSHNLDAS